MAQTTEPLDEIVWRSPGLYQFFSGHLTSMTALLYFRESPFFDRLSNNGSLWTQAQYNPALNILLHSQEALESRLKSMTGLEFVIAMQAPEAGFFAIRKQFRRGRRIPKYDLGERPDAGDGKIEDVRVEGVFFIVGENVYPAPRVGAVLESRQLAVVAHLRRALGRARELAGWESGVGYYYGASVAATAGGGGVQGAGLDKTAPQSQVTTQPPSRIPTPPQSSHAPSQSQSQSQSSSNPPQSISTITTTTTTSTSTTTTAHPSKSTLPELTRMRDSILLSLKHSSEYMDSPPPPAPGLSSTSLSTSTSTSTSLPGSFASAKKPESFVEGGKMSVPVGAAGGKGGQVSAPGLGAQGQGQGKGQGQAQGQSGRDGAPKIKRRKSKAAGLVSPM